MIRGGSQGLEETNVTAIFKKKKKGGARSRIQGATGAGQHHFNPWKDEKMREQVFLEAISKHIMD